MNGVGVSIGGQQKIGQFQPFAFLLLPFAFPRPMVLQKIFKIKIGL